MYDLTYDDPVPIQAARDEPDWSEAAQNVLSFVQETLGKACHPDVRQKISCNVGAVTWDTAREILDLCELVRHSGTPPTRNLNSTSSITTSARARRTRKCRQVEPESNWPPSRYRETRQLLLGSENAWLLLSFENSLPQGGPGVVWHTKSKTFVFVYIVQWIYTAIPLMKVNTWKTNLKATIGTMTAKPNKIHRPMRTPPPDSRLTDEQLLCAMEAARSVPAYLADQELTDAPSPSPDSPVLPPPPPPPPARLEARRLLRGIPPSLPSPSV